MTRKSFLILFSVAALLRVLFVWQAPLWYDENFSLLIARLPFEQFWQAILGDVHPPLYYLIIRPIAQLGGAAWLIRLPSVAFSLAALYFAWKSFIELRVPPLVQFAALTLLTILPTQLWFAQEARMYALLEMLVMIGFYALITKRWWWLTFANLALLYTQNYGLFYVAIFGLMLLLSWQWKALWTCILPGIAWLPWIFVLLGQMKNIAGKYWITSVFSSPASLLNIFPQLFFGASLPGLLVPFGWLMLFATLMIGLVYLVRNKPAHWLGILLMAFGPMLFAIIASLIWQPVMLYRPLLGSTPFICLMICYPLHDVITWSENIKSLLLWNHRTSFYLAILIFVLPVLVANLIGYYVYAPQLKGVMINQALTYIRANWQPNDIIVHTGDGSLVNMLPYSHDLAQVRLIDCESAIGSLSDQTRDALGVQPVSVETLTNAMHMAGVRLWVIGGATPLDPKCFADQIAPLTQGAPAFVIDDNEYISSGVWVVKQ